MQTDDNILRELFLVIYNAGLWDSLSDSAKELGTALMNDDIADLEKKWPINLMPNLGVKNYIEIIEKGMGLSGAQTDFYSIVAKIAYLIYVCEKNRGFATMALSDPDAIMEILK